MNWEALIQSDFDEVIAWAGDTPWGRAMAACQQDKGWHAEGDVWTHTRMVCDQLRLLPEWDSLSRRDQILLLFTALFHDSAKPLTTEVDPETGRTRSPKHAIKGEHLARRVMREIDCDLTIREEIARLVRYHGRPAFLLEKPIPEHEVVRLSWLVNNRLLWLFARADSRGRTTVEMGKPEENLRYWQLLAEELNCLEQPYAFANAEARFQFLQRKNSDLHYVPYENFRCTVTVMSGLPGSGKDTWLARNRSDLPVVSLDDLRGELEVAATDNQGDVVQLAKERCRELLRNGQSFAFNATNLVRQTRERWPNLFTDYGARIEIVYVEPAFPTILTQNRRRPRPVPEKVIRELSDRCEPPNWTEAHELVYSST